MFTTIDLCLLCLTNSTNLKNILSKDSDGEIVKDKLKCFLSKHIQIEPEDSILYICLPCLEKLNDVYNYKRLCLWNINRFNSFIQTLKSTDETSRAVQVTLTDMNINEVTCGNEFNCDSVTTESCKIYNVTVHKDPPEDEAKHRQKPEVVGEIIAKENNEMRYINISDNIENNTDQEEIIKEEVGPELLDDEIIYEFISEIEKEETEDIYDVIDVKSELEKDTFNIEESTSKCGLRSRDKKSHECNECHELFNSRTQLVKHALCHTGEKRFSCDVCGKAYHHISKLERHIRCHTGEKPYKCDVCDKAFTQKFNLVTHIRFHTGEKPYKCDVCDKAFTTQSVLVKHKVIHSGIKPYKCDVCDKAFSYKANLVTHKVCHTGEKPYKCDECDKVFRTQSNLVTHRLTHSGIKHYKCDVCDKAFTFQSRLLMHKLIHSGVKSYKCDVCDKAFTQKPYLLKHKLIHSEEILYKCDACNKAFNTKANLVRQSLPHRGKTL